MSKISGLIFSADPISDTLAAAEHLLEFTDEVVIVYAKSFADYKRFKAKNRDRRIKIFYAIKLGYPEPFRTYGISLCRYSKIAMLDVDERFGSPEAAKKLLDSGEADIYRLQRHEVTPNNKDSKLYTKQYRLFKKGSLEWRGLLHETPRIIGKVKDISIDKLCIIHKTGRAKQWDYNKLNEIFPAERPIKMALRDAYVERGFNHLNISETFGVFFKRYKKHKLDIDSSNAVQKEIIYRLKKEGLIHYLNLDNKKTVEMINNKYKNANEKGIDLMIKIIYDKYYGD